VSGILREKDKWLSIDSDMPKLSLKKQRPPAWPQLEESLSIWMDQAIRYDRTLSGHIMKEKAKRFTELLQINKFTASSGWFDGFKKRYNVREYLRAGEGNSAPLENLPEFRSQLQDVIKNYELRNVFNCDETALFWLLEPNRTLSKGVVVGTKKSKERVTVLLTCSALGEKIKPTFIYRYENPRVLKNIQKSTLPVFYYWNNKAWMQRSIWSAFVKQLNQIMKNQNRHILLLIDNAPCHRIDEELHLTNVTIHPLPENTTAHLQPCDAGIIYSFKVQTMYALRLV